MTEKLDSSGGRTPLDLSNPADTARMTRFVRGELIAKEAGPEFSRSPEGRPRITVNHDTFIKLGGSALPVTEIEDHIIRGEN